MHSVRQIQSIFEITDNEREFKFYLSLRSGSKHVILVKIEYIMCKRFVIGLSDSDLTTLNLKLLKVERFYSASEASRIKIKVL